MCTFMCNVCYNLTINCAQFINIFCNMLYFHSFLWLQPWMNDFPCAIPWQQKFFSCFLSIIHFWNSKQYGWISNEKSVNQKMKRHLNIFPCPLASNRSRCVRWYSLTVFFDLILTWGRKQYALLPPSETSTARQAPGFDTVTFFLFVFAAPSPTPCSFFLGQLVKQLQADRASNVPPSLHWNVPFNLHVAPPGPLTPQLSKSYQQHNIASCWTEQCLVYSMMTVI